MHNKEEAKQMVIQKFLILYEKGWDVTGFDPNHSQYLNLDKSYIEINIKNSKTQTLNILNV